FSKPHELVRIFTAGTTPPGNPSPVTYTEFLALYRATTVRSATAYSTTTRVMTGAGITPVHIVLARAAGDLSSTLGEAPAIGRGLASPERASGARVVVLGYGLWRRSFAGDASIVGRAVLIDGVAHIVAGVMPRGRGYPAGADVWRPLTAKEREDDDRELDV